MSSAPEMLHPPGEAGESEVDRKEREKKARAFKACASCRRAKAKCDLGDVNRPSEPPCARCKRRNVTCNFLPSRRSGPMSFERRQAMEQSVASGKQEDFDDDVFPEASFASASHSGYIPSYENNVLPGNTTASMDFSMSQLPLPRLPSDGPPAPWAALSIQPRVELQSQAFSGPMLPPLNYTGSLVNPSPAASGASSDSAAGTSTYGRSTSSRIGTDGQPVRRLKRQEEEPVHPETLAAASLQNPSDALNLLLLATSEGEADAESTAEAESPGTSRDRPADQAAESSSQDTATTFRYNVRNDRETPSPPLPTLEDFPLIQKGVVKSADVSYLFAIFFSSVHPIFPMVPHHRIPKNEAELAAFTSAELYLSVVFILIASRIDQTSERYAEIHDKTWLYMKELIANLIFGEEATVGAVEALLLLSEYQPRVLAGPGNHRKDFAEGNRTSWMLVGMAVRIGYMLALDQRSFAPPRLRLAKESNEEEAQDRERIAWTYCFLFDRQIAIRTGKAFWSRGPGLMFSGPSEDNFPSMRAIEAQQDDFAGLILAYTEITQILQNAHDCLYPSKDRSNALVSQGEYEKYLDEFTKSLNAFRYTWEGKNWSTFPCGECVWISFHYVRLYIYGFAFHASVSRANKSESSDRDAKASGKIFERGSMFSPDAKFIAEAVEAAVDLLRICLDRLQPRDILRCLPWRFFLYFAYASTFLLKAVFLNAVVSVDRRSIVRLLKQTIVCLASTSQDDHHHAVRYARLLNGMLHTFSRGHDAVDLRNSGPRRKLSVSDEPNNWPISRAASPPLPPASGSSTSGPPPPPPLPGISDFTGQFWNPITGPKETFAVPADRQLHSAAPANAQAYQAENLRDYYLTGDGNVGGSVNGNVGSYGTHLGPPGAFGTAGMDGDSAFVPYDVYSNILGDPGLDFWAALSNSDGDWFSGAPTDGEGVNPFLGI